MAIRHAVLTVAMCVLAVSASAVLTLPPNITAEATGPNGAVVNFHAGVEGGGDDENGRPLEKATCAPASGSQFPFGTTTVNCTGSNGGSGSFTVTVADTRGPELHLPRDFSVPASSSAGAIVTYSSSAEDAVDGAVTVSCSPNSGSPFPIGDTTVQCTAADSRNNMSAGSFAVTVLAQPPPPPPPANDITAEATGPDGAVVTFSAGGGPGDGDDENGRPRTGTCTPASGSTFPLGETTVQCSNGQSFKVKVVDTTAPELTLPANITTQNPTVTYVATATDLVDGPVAVACTPPSGSTFPDGITTVHCSAGDARGNSAAGSFTVTVEDAPPPDDTEAPVFTSLTASPDELWPPNGKLVTVTISASVTDNVDDAPYVGVFDVTANEAITIDDWNVLSPLSVELRADRDPHGSGRVYTVWVEAIDAAGNRSVSTVTVTVPHDQGDDGDGTRVPVVQDKKAKRLRGRR